MKNIPLCFIVCLLFIVFTGCKSNSEDIPDSIIELTEGTILIIDSTLLIPVEAISMDYFPCNDCHVDLLPNPRRRELIEMHDDIIFNHDSENRWCLACHNTFDRDSLVLAGGKLLGFNESYKLCGQCHGPKYRDWKLGIHGKRTGEWDGTKQYLLCVHCHDPHSPRFKVMQPLPVPRRPEQIYIDSIYERQEKKSTSP
jgi:hypothetical protein